MARNTKALSPVIATIILVAVTVAIAIAVATWMGMLSFTYLKAPEELQFLNVVVVAGNSTSGMATLTIENTGPAASSINHVYIYDAEVSSGITPALPKTIAPGETFTLTIVHAFDTGVKYTIKLVTAQGNQFPLVFVVSSA